MNEEITFLRGVSGSFTDVLLLTCSTWNERGYDKKYEILRLQNHENLSDNIYDGLRTLLAEMGRPVYSLKTSRFYPNAAGFTRSQL